MKEGKINIALLVSLLNPAVFVTLASGLLLGYDTATLIVVGVMGYSIWGVLKYLSCRQGRS